MTRCDPIRIVAYDPVWPELFRREAKRIQAALEPYATGPVEQMGSTAVPGLPAKPIIDMFVPLRSYDDGPEIASALSSIGWVSAPEPDDDDLRRLSFCFPNVEYRTHHLHAIEDQSPRWRAWLAFRDALRRDPATAAQYGRLKERLAHQFADNREAYRSGKTDFVEGVLGRASRAGSLEAYYGLDAPLPRQSHRQQVPPDNRFADPATSHLTVLGATSRARRFASPLCRRGSNSGRSSLSVLGAACQGPSSAG